MFNKIKPSLIVDRIDNLDIDKLISMGIEGLVIDIDNTITHHDQLDCELWASNFIAHIKQKGMKICLVSNNNLKRVNPICSQLNVVAVSDAGKPSKHAYEKALALLGVNAEHAVAIGDQLFTDILGGNRAGLFTVLVTPISPKEALRIKVFRPVEKVFRLFL